MKALIIIMAAAAVASIPIGFGVQSSEIGRQQAQITQRTAELTRLQHQLASDEQRLANLEDSVATLNTPTDPLSAYSVVCNQDMTNSVTGITQVYYFPCTNQAQTIPQPAQ